MNRIDFDKMEWSSPRPHLRHKVYKRDGRRLRLVCRMTGLKRLRIITVFEAQG